MSGTVGYVALERLLEHGVPRVYGYPGDGINGFLGAFHESALEFVQVRHEGDRRFRGHGSREAHRRGRGLHGDVRPWRDPPSQRADDAKLDRQPVVAIVGQQKDSRWLGADYQQEVDLQSSEDVASEYIQTGHSGRSGNSSTERSRSPVSRAR